MPLNGRGKRNLLNFCKIPKDYLLEDTQLSALDRGKTNDNLPGQRILRIGENYS